MISVLIPVYNVDVTLLVRDLLQQLDRDKLPCELIVFDDGSREAVKAINREACLDKPVIYQEQDRNYGRVEIRKRLAQAAKFEWLLFIDCDSTIVKQNYLQAYKSHLVFSDAIVGGTVYQEEPPPCDRRLHWKYGTYREVITPKKKSFRSNNFCIRKALFLDLQIPVELSGYGHEDTFIGIELERKGSRISYIGNPVLHEGIEDTPTFISKSESALKNLLQLRKYIDESSLRRHVTLYDVYCKTRTLKPLLVSAFGIIKPLLLRNLNSCNPRLSYFDFYRLCRLNALSRQE